MYSKLNRTALILFLRIYGMENADFNAWIENKTVPKGRKPVHIYLLQRIPPSESASETFSSRKFAKPVKCRKDCSWAAPSSRVPPKEESQRIRGPLSSLQDEI